MERVVLVILLLVILVIPFQSSALSETNSFNMQVYSDGSAAVVQSTAVNKSDVSITLPLISAIITNVIATDQNGSPLSFQISGGNITVYTIGATFVTVQYNTDSLTTKQGSVWTLSFTSLYNLTVVLPNQASLSSVSGTPTSLSDQNGSPVVVVPPGHWNIKYGVPIEATATSATVTHSSMTTSVTVSSNSVSSNSISSVTSTSSLILSPKSSSLFWIAGVLGMVAAGGGIGFVILRRRGEIDLQNSELRPDDVQVLDYVSDKGGKVFEQEIRSRFTLPKTSAWRQIKRLERLGYVKVYKIGSQNQIELLKKRERLN